MTQDERESLNIEHVDLDYPIAMRMLVCRLLTVKHELKNVNEDEKWLQKEAKAGETIAMRKCGTYLIHQINRWTYYPTFS
ncbi:hypothetical protein [Priestia aryabhattai]|uniref:hypothetical protein n=1 Tax=Priestia aryabhattai TaxID=412384 RepID=UPI003D2D239B